MVKYLEFEGKLNFEMWSSYKLWEQGRILNIQTSTWIGCCYSWPVTNWGRAKVGTRQSRWEVNELNWDQNQWGQGSAISQKNENWSISQEKTGVFPIKGLNILISFMLISSKPYQTTCLWLTRF